MKRIAILAFSAGMVLFWSCSGNDPAPEAVPAEPEPVLSIPGTVRLPGEDGFTEMSESEHQAVLLYCWMPMGNYPESETDLWFLSTLGERGITPVPIQFSPEVRNASQNQLNRLGISLPVALGDDSLRAFLNISILPAAVLVQNTGVTVRGSGIGCAERLVRSVR